MVEAGADTPIIMALLPLARVAVVIGVAGQEDGIIMVKVLGQEHQGPADQADQQMVLPVVVLGKLVRME